MRSLWMWGLALGIGLLMGCVPIQAPGEDAAPTPDELETRAMSVSPDGQWRAESVVAFPPGRDEYYQRLTVTRSDGQVRWTPVETWSHMGLGYTVAVPFAWSGLDDALYFTEGSHPDGCALFAGGWGLMRLDLTSGQSTEVIPGAGSPISLSPAEDKVAEVVYSPLALVLHTIGGQASRTQPLAKDNTTQAGSLVWSPDGTHIALALAHDPCMGGWARATSVLVVDATTLEINPLLEENDRLLKPVEWKTAHALTLEGEGRTRFILDPTTRELMPSP